MIKDRKYNSHVHASKLSRKDLDNELLNKYMKSCTSFLTSVWNLLSHRYRDVFIGLKGSKSIFTRFSFPSSVNIIPQYNTSPFSGILLYNFNFC
jgi:hypothetical protein